jgi:hypothetical protein
LDGNDGLDFGPSTETKKIVIENQGTSPMNVVIQNPGGISIVYLTININTGAQEWKPVTTLTQTVPPGATNTITLGADRINIPSSSDGVLTVSAGGIVRQFVVSIQNPTVIMPNAYTGLWIGTVTLNAVSEPHSASPNTTTATPAEFIMRLILHVDTNGTTRLLKEVYLMKKPNPPGSNLANPGPQVLLSNPALIPMFQTPGNRDGARFAPRASSVGYDFDGVDLALSGAFGGTLTGNIVTARSSPTNPFKHRYHPDHDDLTANYQPPPANQPSEQQEVWEVARAIQLTFTPPPADQAPSTGFSERNGSYHEEVTGLHKKHLFTDGTFTLKRINMIGEINPP